MAVERLKIKFIMKVAAVLHRYGASSDRIEAAMYQLSAKLNILAEFFSLPTSFMATFSTGRDEEFTRMLRLEPGKINLEKLYYADNVVDEVLEERMTLQEGINFLDKLMLQKSIHSEFLVNISIMVLATCVTVVLGGGWYDSLLAGAAGLLSGLVSTTVKLERLDTIKEGVICFVIGFIAILAAHYIPEVNPQIVILAALIYYIPGLNLTMAMGELSSQNLTAGTARLAGAFIILLKIGFGAFLGGTVAQGFFPTIGNGHVFDHGILLLPAVVLISISFVISFQARWQETPWIILAGNSTFFLHYFIKDSFDNLVATLLVGIYIGAASNLYSRLLNRPSMTFSLPAIILLVPGSVGFKGFEFLFGNQTITGISTIFTTFNIGLALVAGTYFGNILIKPRRMI